jgi:hypothetical protein
MDYEYIAQAARNDYKNFTRNLPPRDGRSDAPPRQQESLFVPNQPPTLPPAPHLAQSSATMTTTTSEPTIQKATGVASAAQELIATPSKPPPTNTTPEPWTKPESEPLHTTIEKLAPTANPHPPPLALKATAPNSPSTNQGRGSSAGAGASTWTETITAGSKISATIKTANGQTYPPDSMAASIATGQQMTFEKAATTLTRISMEQLKLHFHTTEEVKNCPDLAEMMIPGLTQSDIDQAKASVQFLRQGTNGSQFAASAKKLAPEDYPPIFRSEHLRTGDLLINPHTRKWATADLSELHHQLRDLLKTGELQPFRGMIRPGIANKFGRYKEVQVATHSQCAALMMLHYQLAWQRSNTNDPTTYLFCPMCGYAPGELGANPTYKFEIPKAFAIAAGDHAGEVCVTNCGCGAHPIGKFLCITTLTTQEKQPQQPRINKRLSGLFTNPTVTAPSSPKTPTSPTEPHREDSATPPLTPQSPPKRQRTSSKKEEVKHTMATRQRSSQDPAADSQRDQSDSPSLLESSQNREAEEQVAVDVTGAQMKADNTVVVTDVQRPGEVVHVPVVADN